MAFSRNDVPFFREADTVGNGSGSMDLTVNGSVSPVTFKLQPIGDQLLHLARAIFHIEISGNLRAEFFTATGPLTNGVQLQWWRDGSLYLDLLGGFPIKTAADISHFCYDVTPIVVGAGNNFWAARWTFAQSGAPIILSSNRGDEMRVIINDDLTSLVDFHVNFQGVIKGTG